MSYSRLLIICFLFSAFGCAEEKDSRTIKEELLIDLRSDIDSLKSQNDSLLTVIQQLPSEESWFNPGYDGAEFIRKGIKEPEEYIKKALIEQPELLPAQGVLGGTMHFVKIEVLSEKWVIAQYEDGHVMGKALYSYDLEKDGTISFQLIDAVD